MDFGIKNLCAGVLVWISHSDSFWHTYIPGKRIVKLNVKSMLNFSLPNYSAFPSDAFNICQHRPFPALALVMLLDATDTLLLCFNLF